MLFGPSIAEIAENLFLHGGVSIGERLMQGLAEAPLTKAQHEVRRRRSAQHRRPRVRLEF
jgi:hypothetical protein